MFPFNGRWRSILLSILRCCFCKAKPTTLLDIENTYVSDCIRRKLAILKSFRFSEEKAIFKKKMCITKVQLFSILFAHCFNYPSFSPPSFLHVFSKFTYFHFRSSMWKWWKLVVSAFLKFREFSATFLWLVLIWRLTYWRILVYFSAVDSFLSVHFDYL